MLDSIFDRKHDRLPLFRRHTDMTLSYYVRPVGALKDTDKTREVYEVQDLWVVGRTVRYTVRTSGTYIFTVPLSDLKSVTD